MTIPGQMVICAGPRQEQKSGISRTVPGQLATMNIASIEEIILLILKYRCLLRMRERISLRGKEREFKRRMLEGM